MTISSSSEKMLSRLELYGVYDSEESLQREIEKYNVDTSMREVRQDSLLDDADDDLPISPFSGGGGGGATSTTTAVPVDTQSGDANNNNNPNSTIATRQQASVDRDVWGRFPLKEAKDPILCPACTRPINTNRFALHLDKCMGIGTTVRSASGALGTTNTRSAANTAK